MTVDLRLHHVGWAVADMGAAAEAFQTLGYVAEATLPEAVDESFGVRLRFLCRPGDPVLVELVQPTRADSSVSAVLARGGAGPYHLGYCVNDLAAAARKLRAGRFRPATSRHRAPALGMREIQFFHRGDTGLIELIQWPIAKPQT
jgi:methylmalonyl-CoA/ethylmalonyl-CoA epimerase